MNKSICLAVIAALFQLSAFSQAAEANSLLWRIDKAGSYNKPSYLFGTIHVAHKDIMNLKDSLYYAINNTSALYTEIDFSEKNMMKNFGAILPLMTRLDSLMKTGAWKAFVKRNSKPGDNEDEPPGLDGLSKLMGKDEGSLFEKEPGLEALDIMLSRHAASLGKKTGGLETMDLQVNLVFDLLNIVVTDSTVNIADRSRMESGLEQFYIDERVDSMTALFKNMNPKFVDLMLNKRNRNMADSMVRAMANEPSFFAVGGGHLVGDEGIVSLLRKKGFTVSPVHSKNRISLVLINDIKKAAIRYEKGDKKEEAVDKEGFEKLFEGLKNMPVPSAPVEVKPEKPLPPKTDPKTTPAKKPKSR